MDLFRLTKKEQSYVKNIETSNESNTVKKKMTSKKKLIIALCCVLGVIVILFAVSFGVFNHYYSKLNTHSPIENDEIIISDTDTDDLDELTEEQKSELEKYMDSDFEDGLKFDDKNVTNILLVGTDSRKKGIQRSRSDTMIIISINRNTKQITMTSLMRDMYVNIPGVRKQRINAAYVYGGPKLLFKTIDANFGISLDKYAQIDFYSFIEIVDAVGGVDLNVTAAEIKVMNKTYLPYINKSLGLPKNDGLLDPAKAGKMHLSGKQALAYARVRYVGNADFERTERQRKVLTEIFKKAKKMSLSELDDFADVLLPLITTNLTRTEVLSILVNSPEYLSYDLQSKRIPIDGSYTYMKVNGASVLGVDFAKNRKYWYKNVYGDQ